MDKFLLRQQNSMGFNAIGSNSKETGSEIVQVK